MPVYAFYCSTCGDRFDARLSFQEDGKAVTCPQGHKEVRKVYSTPSVVFKGSGFYVTDHRKSSAGESSAK